MRHYEFIVEYNTQATVKAMGNKILDALMLPQLLQALKTAVHQETRIDPMVKEPYYIFYRGGSTLLTINPTKLLNHIQMTIPRPSLMEFQSLAASKLIQYVYKEVVERMEQDPRDSGWQNSIQRAWKDGIAKLGPEIVSETIQLLESFDPTPNKQYTLQIVKWFLDNGSKEFPKIEDGMSTLKEALYYFQKMKARLPEKYRDIRQYKSTKEFIDSVQHYRDEYGKKEELPKGKSEIIYQTKDVTVRWAEDQEAACHLGQGTQWCTASTKADNYFDQYNKEGPLIIVNFTKPFIIGYDVDGTEEEQKLDPSFDLEKQIQKLQMHFTNSSEEDPDEYYDPGNWEVAQIADEADDVIDFNALYDSGPWNTNMGGDETYESPFKKMWDDSKFHNAIDKVWEHWEWKHWRVE